MAPGEILAVYFIARHVLVMKFEWRHDTAVHGSGEPPFGGGEDEGLRLGVQDDLASFARTVGNKGHRGNFADGEKVSSGDLPWR